LLKERWNQELAFLFVGFGEWDRRVGDWGRKLLDRAGMDAKAEPSSQADAK